MSGDLKRICPNCGAENSYTDRFCLKCGKKFPESPMDLYGNISNAKKRETSDSNPMYDNIKNKAKNKSNKPEKLDHKPPIQKQKPEGFKSWWKSKDFVTKSLIILFSILGICFLFVGAIAMSMPADASLNETNVENVTEDTLLDAEEQEKIDKMSEIENSEEFKNDINQFVEDGYGYEDLATLKNLRVIDLLSDNEIEVSFDVDWTDKDGDTQTDTYTGTWVKNNGKWTDKDIERQSTVEL